MLETNERVKDWEGDYMSDRISIEARIAELRGELARVEGRPAEVYSRIVGYYRSVRNWNAGKRSEYEQRSAFAMPGGVSAMSRRAAAEPAEASASGRASGEAEPDRLRAAAAKPQAEASGSRAAAGAEGKGMLVFTREACPNCSPVANYVIGAGIPATFVDVDRDEGLELARRHGIMATPTVLGMDEQGRELFRALNLGQLKERLGAARV